MEVYVTPIRQVSKVIAPCLLSWPLTQIWVAYTIFTTTVAPVIPFWPFAPGSLGAFEYPHPILRMGG